MSAFADLLKEAQDRLHVLTREATPIHFTWDGTSGPESWSCWHSGSKQPGFRPIYRGSAGEEALRRLVEAMRG